MRADVGHLDCPAFLCHSGLSRLPSSLASKPWLIVGAQGFAAALGYWSLVAVQSARGSLLPPASCAVYSASGPFSGFAVLPWPAYGDGCVVPCCRHGCLLSLRWECLCPSLAWRRNLLPLCQGPAHAALRLATRILTARVRKKGTQKALQEGQQ